MNENYRTKSENRQQRRRKRMSVHGKSLMAIYVNVINKKAKKDGRRK